MVAVRQGCRLTWRQLDREARRHLNREAIRQGGRLTER